MKKTYHPDEILERSKRVFTEKSLMLCAGYESPIIMAFNFTVSCAPL